MSTSPAGWYPQEDGRQRYWDGSQWTEHFAPGADVGAMASSVATGDQARELTRKPWFKKKRVIIPAGVLAIAVLGSALSPDDAATPVAAPTAPSSKPLAISPNAGASPAATSKPVDPAVAKASAAAKAKADAAAKIRAAADAKAKAAAAAKAKAAAALAPYNDTYGSFKSLTKSGRGDAIVKLPSGASAGVVKFTHRGSSNVAASVLDASNQPTGDLLVNEIGNYAGTTAFGLHDFGGDPVKIKITADGGWTIKISPISTAPTLGKSIKGQGDKVFRYDGSGSDWAVSHKGSSNFAVIQVGGLLPNMAVNEIGNYSGEVPLTEGPSVVTVTADGRWSLVRK